MKNLSRWNVIIVIVFIVLPILIAYYINYARLVWTHIGLITNIINYTAPTITCSAGFSLVILNILALKRKESQNKLLSILFILVGIAAAVYGFAMFVVAYAFRNGINF